MSLELLENLGFVHSATCSLNNQRLRIEIHAHENATNLLYAFVENEDVRYIGYTERSLSNRLYGYGRPGAGQTTNLRVNANSTNVLNEGSELEIYCFADQDIVQYRGININLAAGIELNLIRQVAQSNHANNSGPFWNLRGNPYFNQGIQAPLEAQEEELIAENAEYIPVPEVFVEDFESVEVPIALNNTYYYKSFFNLPTEASHLLSAAGESIIVDLTGMNPGVISDRRINRTANANGAPRLHLGNRFKDWVQLNHQLRDTLTVRILNPNHIQLI